MGSSFVFIFFPNEEVDYESTQTWLTRRHTKIKLVASLFSLGKRGTSSKSTKDSETWLRQS